MFGRKPLEREVDWVAEGSFCVRAGKFAEIGGFDVKMRHHETHDLGKRIRSTGAIIKFALSIIARHTEINVRGELRQKEFTDAQQYFYQKHWGMSKEIFDQLFDIPKE